MRDDKKTQIKEALAELKKAHESKDLGTIDSAMEKINTAWKAASEEMYKASQESAGSNTNDNNTEEGADSKGDDVTDVEFEEVKEEELIELYNLKKSPTMCRAFFIFAVCLER